MRAVFGAALLVLLSNAAAVAQFPAVPPVAGTLRPFRLPGYQETTLGNGVRLIVVENHRLPVFSVSVSVVAGSKRDAAGKEGTATILADLITKGTPSRTAAQITSQVEALGGMVAAEADVDFLTFGTGGLTESAGPLFDIAADLVQNSSWGEFDAAKKRYLASLEREKNDPQAIGERFFSRAVYGEHPYGRRSSVTSVQALTRDDVARHAAAWIGPSNTLIVVTGDLTLAQARQHVQRAFGSWRGTTPPTNDPAPPANAASRIRLVNRPGAVQSSITVGNAGLSATDRRQYALIVGNRILGGGNDARLTRELRDDKRWSPDAHSEIGRRQDLGHFLVTAQVRQQVTDQALTLLADHFEKFRTEAVADSELTRARQYLAGSFPRQVETAQQVAAQVATARLMGLGDDYVRTFRERVTAVTADDVLAAAKAAAHPDSAVIVVVGDAKVLHDKLKMIAPVDLMDPEGKPLTVDDLTPKPGPLMVDRSQYVSRKDSFVVIVNGSPLGTFVTQTVAQGDSLSYHESLSIPVARWSLDTKARLSLTDMVMRSLDQTGSMSNQPAETHLLFSGNRVTGKAQIPQPGGTPKVNAIDTTVVPGVVDVGAVPLVVPGLPLEPQTQYTIFAFDAASASVKPVQVTVMAVGNLGVPAGVFPVSQVQVMGPQPLILYITRESPRRIVKIERMGQPMSFELVK